MLCMITLWRKLSHADLDSLHFPSCQTNKLLFHQGMTHRLHLEAKMCQKPWWKFLNTSGTVFLWVLFVQCCFLSVLFKHAETDHCREENNDVGVTLACVKVSVLCELEENNSWKCTVTKSSCLAVTTNEKRNIFTEKLRTTCIKYHKCDLQSINDFLFWKFTPWWRKNLDFL